MSIIVIYGPRATGKTIHAERFRRAYGCKRILDGWPVFGIRSKPRDGDLVLSERELSIELPGARFVSIHDARRQVGLPPVPKKGFLARR